jgi:hypothetical protein
MRFGTCDHVFNIHDVQLIILFISLTKIKDIVENLDELCMVGVLMQGRIQDFKLGGGALKKIAPSGRRCENCWGISCEKSQF